MEQEDTIPSEELIPIDALESFQKKHDLEHQLHDIYKEQDTIVSVFIDLAIRWEDWLTRKTHNKRRTRKGFEK